VNLALPGLRRTKHEHSRYVRAVAVDSRAEIDQQQVSFPQPAIAGTGVRERTAGPGCHDRIERHGPGACPVETVYELGRQLCFGNTLGHESCGLGKRGLGDLYGIRDRIDLARVLGRSQILEDRTRRLPQYTAALLPENAPVTDRQVVVLKTHAGPRFTLLEAAPELHEQVGFGDRDRDTVDEFLGRLCSVAEVGDERRGTRLDE